MPQGGAHPPHKQAKPKHHREPALGQEPADAGQSEKEPGEAGSLLLCAQTLLTTTAARQGSQEGFMIKIFSWKTWKAVCFIGALRAG